MIACIHGLAHRLPISTSMQALSQCVKETCTLAFDLAEALELQEHLRIVIRSDPIADNDPNDEFLIGALNALYMQDMPMKAQLTGTSPSWSANMLHGWRHKSPVQSSLSSSSKRITSMKNMCLQVTTMAMVSMVAMIL